MSFKEVADLDCDVTFALGGLNKKTGKANPTKVEGYFIGSKEVESPRSNTGVAKLHIFQTAKGNVGVWGKTDLDRKMLAVPAGTMTQVQMVGKVAIPGKNDMYKYKVAIDSENVIEVSSSSDIERESPTEETASEEAAEQAAYEALDVSVYDESAEEIEETSPEEEQAEVDIPPPSRPVAPKRPAAAPDAARQAKVKALLGKRNKTTA